MRRKVEIDPERIVIVPGGKVTMYFAITMFGEPGVEIMYPDPGFPIYRSVIEFSGAKAIPIPLYEKKRVFVLGRGGVEPRSARRPG